MYALLNSFISHSVCLELIAHCIVLTDVYPVVLLLSISWHCAITAVLKSIMWVAARMCISTGQYSGCITAFKSITQLEKALAVYKNLAEQVLRQPQHWGEAASVQGQRKARPYRVLHLNPCKETKIVSA